MRQATSARKVIKIQSVPVLLVASSSMLSSCSVLSMDPVVADTASWWKEPINKSMVEVLVTQCPCSNILGGDLHGEVHCYDAKVSLRCVTMEWWKDKAAFGNGPGSAD
jgi:hypothetical protein